MTHIMPPCNTPVTVLHADDDMVVIHKPHELLSVPGRHPDNRDSATVRLEAHFGTIFVVHRLDASTSGLMVFARNKAAERNLSMQFQARQVKKRYRAIVHGIMTEASGCITLPLIADWPRRPRQKVCYEHGKPSETRYEMVNTDTARNLSEIVLTPITGRSHQLRVHCSASGFPIVGCEFYADHIPNPSASRLLLHAEMLSFSHPSTNELVTFALPASFF